MKLNRNILSCECALLEIFSRLEIKSERHSEAKCTYPAEAYRSMVRRQRPSHSIWYWFIFLLSTFFRQVGVKIANFCRLFLTVEWNELYQIDEKTVQSSVHLNLLEISDKLLQFQKNATQRQRASKIVDFCRPVNFRERIGQMSEWIFPVHLCSSIWYNIILEGGERSATSNIRCLEVKT